MNIPIDEQIARQRAVIRHCEGKSGINIDGDKAILATLERVKAAESGLPVEPEYLIRLRNALKGFKSDGAFAGDKDIVDYIDSLQSALQVAQQDRDNCYASLDNVRRRLHEIETFVTGDANEYRINKKLKDDEKSIKSLIEHLLAMADNYHTVNQLYIQAKERAEKAEAALREQGRRSEELLDNGQRLLEAADGWKLKAEMAENAELRKDAERYRWLADKVMACDYGDNNRGCVGWNIRHCKGPDWIAGLSIDAAIDKARSAND